MKRFIYIVFLGVYLCLSLIHITEKPVIASQETYYRVLKDNVYIYSDSTLTTPMFKIPYTYYVKAESVNNDVARVVYGNDLADYPVIIGYMNVLDLTLTQTTPLNPYAITKISTKAHEVLFNDFNKKKPYFNVASETFMIYYGEILDSNGVTMCMVYCNNKLGYIDKSAINTFAIPNNTDPLPLTPPDNEQELNPDENIEKPTAILGENLQIIIIVGISTVCISVVYALFKPTKNKAPSGNEYFEEGE